MLERTRSVHPAVPGLLAVSLCLSAVAYGDEQSDKATCVRAAEQGQLLQRQGKLLAAAKEFLQCANPACPNLVVADCMRFSAEVERSTPSVVFRARDNTGRDVVEVTVTIDGALATRRVKGRAILVDPGVHTVRFETDGYPPVERQLMATEGDKLRSFDVVFGPSSSVPVAPVRAQAPERKEPPSGPPTISWILGGVGLACLGGFAYFGLSASSEYGELEDSCGRTRTCTDDQVHDFERDALVADIFLGAGMVSLSSAGLVWALTSSQTDRDDRAWMVVPSPAGGSVQVVQRF